MPNYRFVIDGVTYDVNIDDPFASPATVVVNGERFLVETEAEQLPQEPVTYEAPAPVQQAAPAPAPEPAAPPKPAAAPAPAGAATVVAPMPGKILAVNVSVGDTVQVGDSVATIEAMKMEMAVRSGASGTVREVRVSPGQSVKNAEVLVVLG